MHFDGKSLFAKEKSLPLLLLGENSEQNIKPLFNIGRIPENWTQKVLNEGANVGRVGISKVRTNMPDKLSHFQVKFSLEKLQADFSGGKCAKKKKSATFHSKHPDIGYPFSYFRFVFVRV